MYKLVNEFPMGAPVRCIDQGLESSSNIDSAKSTIYVGCQDAVLYALSLDSVTSQLEPSTMPGIQHDHWVTSVLSVLPQAAANVGYSFITGCQDGKIRLYDASGNRVAILEGHTNGVISLCWGNQECTRIFSGSWDGTAMQWDISSLPCPGPVMTYPKHENGVHVCVVAQQPTPVLATVSTGEAVDGRPANFQLRFFDIASGKQIGQGIRDHTGSIRNICLNDSDGIITCANDGSIMMRYNDGMSITQVFHPPSIGTGELPFILDVTRVGISDVVSCGEDGSLVVWRSENGDFKMHQSLQHPGCLWCVKQLSNGDFLTGCQDGILRVWSMDSSKNTTIEAIAMQEAFVNTVEISQLRQQKGPDAAEIASYPSWHDRGQHVAPSEGFVKLFNRDGKGIAAQWSMDTKAWIEVGEVTGSSQAKESIDGVEYDTVLPVEMETTQGLMTFQLGYNNGENPFVAAQRFLDKHGIDQSYHAQIADWIIARQGQSSQPTIDMSGSQSDNVSASNVGIPSQMPIEPPVPKYTYLPVTNLLSFDDVPKDLSSKLLPKLGDVYSASSAYPSSSEANQLMIQDLLDILEKTSSYHVSELPASGIKALSALLQEASSSSSSMPRKALFVLYDVLRMVTVHPAGSKLIQTLELGRSLIHTTMAEILREGSTDEKCAGSTNTTVTALRFLSNSLKDGSMKQHFVAALETNVLTGFMAQLSSISSSNSKLIRSAVASLVLNIIIVLSEITTPPENALEIYKDCFSVTQNMLFSEQESVDTIVRSVLAVGTAIITTADILKTSFPEEVSTLKITIEGLVSPWKDRLGTKLKCLEETLEVLS